MEEQRNCTQVFTIDNAAPTITCPADATVECYEDIQALVDAAVLAFNGGTDVTIACDLTWNVVGVVDAKIDNCTPSYDVVYTITDECGQNSAVAPKYLPLIMRLRRLRVQRMRRWNATKTSKRWLMWRSWRLMAAPM